MRQVLISDIKIGTRFRKEIGDLKPLEKSITQLNCLLHPIVVEQLDNGKFKLIAGKRRILACKNLGWSKVPINSVRIPLSQAGELHENGVRKDFTGSEIVAISEYIEKTRIGHRPKKGEAGPPLPKGKTGDLVQEITGVSRNTVTRMKTIVDAAKENPKKYGKFVQDLDNGTIPPKKLFREVKKLKEITAKKEALKKVQVKLPKSVKLFNGDFRDNKILKNSVSLMITDPDYTNYNIQVYADLAKQAMQVLKDGGSILCYCGHYILREVMNAMVEQGLNFHWLIPVLHSGPSSLMFSKKIMVGYKPLLWFTKGKYDGRHVKDVIKSEFQGKELHEWAQSTIESDYYIKHMTEENEIVYDPCMGQGTFGISAAKLKRQFIGSDINSEHYNTAKKLITLGFKESISAKPKKLTDNQKQELKKQKLDFNKDFDIDQEKPVKKLTGDTINLIFHFDKKTNMSWHRAGPHISSGSEGGGSYEKGTELSKITSEIIWLSQSYPNRPFKVRINLNDNYAKSKKLITVEQYLKINPQKKLPISKYAIAPKKIKTILKKFNVISKEVLDTIA